MLEPVPTPLADAVPEVTVLLEGGPETIPAELRRHQAVSTSDIVKVAHCGGYEHFERDGSGVFRWTQRTRMAE